MEEIRISSFLEIRDQRTELNDQYDCRLQLAVKAKL